MASMPIYNVQVPYVGVVEQGFPPGKLVKVQGTVLPSAYRFAINLQCGPNAAVGDDIALHFNPRFDNNCIVRNSLQSMNWQREEEHGPMPLARGQGFEILILCDPNHYKIAVNGQHFAEFNHRIPFQRVSHISIEGDVTVAAIIYEGGPNLSGGLGHAPVAPGFAPPTQPHMPGAPSMPHSGGGNIYPSVPMAGAPSAMSYPTQPPAAYPSQPSGYGPPQPQPHGQGQPMYGQGYQQQPPYPGYGQPLPGQPLPGQYSHSPSGYPQGYQPPGYQPQGYQPPGYQPQGHQQYPSSPSQGSGFSLDKAGAALAGALGSASLMGALGGRSSTAPASNRGGIGGLFDQAGAALTGALGSSGLMGGARPPNPPPMPQANQGQNTGNAGFSGLANLGLQNMLPTSLDQLKNLVQPRK